MTPTFFINPKGRPVTDNVGGDVRLHAEELHIRVDCMEHEEGDPRDARPINRINS